MIALLSGQLAYRSPEQIILDVNGVGYRLQVPLSTFYVLPEEGAVKLQVHTHVKEDAISLFGFATRGEKELFILLISVSGVGPKLAITILSHIQTAELALAISEGNVPALTAIPGIGKKSAERLILELQDKATKYAVAAAIVSSESSQPKAINYHHDAISALVNLGYKEALAKKALNAITITPGMPLEDILKAALQVLLK